MKNRHLLIAAALLLSTGLGAKKISGTVSCEGAPLEGVIITDGVNFTTTNEEGVYKIAPAKGSEYVYIVTPSGYIAPWESGAPEFYKRIDGKDYDFSLEKFGTGAEDYTLITIADPQTQSPKHFNRFLNGPLPDLSATCQSYSAQGTTIGLVLGDISWDSGRDIFPEYRKAITQTGIPFYPAMGNHDYEKALKGDKATSDMYRSFFGPENYAFCIGGDWFLVLDSIIYDTEKKYEESYSEAQLEWVKSLLEYIPEDAGIWVAQHAPYYRWFKEEHIIGNGEKMLALFGSRKVNFVSGHTHINNNFQISETAFEHNVAAICGTWWMSPHCNDGTPGGYKVFEKRDGSLQWYYKSNGYDKDFQVEIFPLGSSAMHPHSIVANVWDYDDSWTVRWSEDGVDKGSMIRTIEYSPLYKAELDAAYPEGKTVPAYKRPRPNNHYFFATPSEGAKSVTIEVESRFGQHWKYDISLQ